MKPHLELAEKYGVMIAVENLFDIKDTSGKIQQRFSARTEELIQLCDKIRELYSNIGICWDFGHANIMGCNQAEELKNIGSRLLTVHVSDNSGLLDDHLLPYGGTIEWTPLIKTLKEIKYRGVFAYETHKFTVNMPEDLIDAALMYSLEIGKYLVSLFNNDNQVI